jgi:hypothetical protein
MKIRNGLLSAAVAGIVTTAFVAQPALAKGRKPKKDKTDTTMEQKMDKKMTADSHGCKGMNECKGQGGCKTDKHACKGMNDCKGQGGCGH